MSQINQESYLFPYSPQPKKFTTTSKSNKNPLFCSATSYSTLGQSLKDRIAIISHGEIFPLTESSSTVSSILRTSNTSNLFRSCEGHPLNSTAKTNDEEQEEDNNKNIKQLFSSTEQFHSKSKNIKKQFDSSNQELRPNPNQPGNTANPNDRYMNKLKMENKISNYDKQNDIKQSNRQRYGEQQQQNKRIDIFQSTKLLYKSQEFGNKAKDILNKQVPSKQAFVKQEVQELPKKGYFPLKVEKNNCLQNNESREDVKNKISKTLNSVKRQINYEENEEEFRSSKQNFIMKIQDEDVSEVEVEEIKEEDEHQIEEKLQKSKVQKKPQQQKALEKGINPFMKSQKHTPPQCDNNEKLKELFNSNFSKQETTHSISSFHNPNLTSQDILLELKAREEYEERSKLEGVPKNKHCECKGEFEHCKNCSFNNSSSSKQKLNQNLNLYHNEAFKFLMTLNSNLSHFKADENRRKIRDAIFNNTAAASSSVSQAPKQIISSKIKSSIPSQQKSKIRQETKKEEEVMVIQNNQKINNFNSPLVSKQKSQSQYEQEAMKTEGQFEKNSAHQNIALSAFKSAEQIKLISPILKMYPMPCSMPNTPSHKFDSQSQSSQVYLKKSMVVKEKEFTVQSIIASSFCKQFSSFGKNKKALSSQKSPKQMKEKI